jgi:hypothetical protein
VIDGFYSRKRRILRRRDDERTHRLRPRLATRGGFEPAP